MDKKSSDFKRFAKSNLKMWVLLVNHLKIGISLKNFTPILLKILSLYLTLHIFIELET